MVDFHFKEENAMAIYQVMHDGICIIAREWAEQEGHLQDWEKAIGTSPWIVTDFVSGSLLIFSSNFDYWGYDERHLKNKLPYLNKIKVLEIPDTSTAVAAIGTNKIDILDSLSCVDAKNLINRKKNIQVASIPASASANDFKCDAKPFSDIKIRKA